MFGLILAISFFFLLKLCFYYYKKSVECNGK
jgi:hypothetical protein